MGAQMNHDNHRHIPDMHSEAAFPATAKTMEAFEYINEHAVILLAVGILLWIYRLQTQQNKLQIKVGPDGQWGRDLTNLNNVNHALKTNIELNATAYEQHMKKKEAEIEGLNAQCTVFRLEMERVRLEMTQQSQLHSQAMEGKKEKHKEELAKMKLNHETEMDKMDKEHAHQLEMTKCKTRQDIEEMFDSIMKRLPATHFTPDVSGPVG